MSRPRCSEGGKRNRYRPFVAFVEGTEHGVPYRIFFKSGSCAQRMAKTPGAVMVCLITLQSWRWIRGQWVITA